MPILAVPIRTETVVRRTPSANLALISVNVLTYLAFHPAVTSDSLWNFREHHLHLISYYPSWYQFFTYQFSHADTMHLLGNMLFLWVFGNSVNVKMGHGPYVLFYLAGGAFAGLGHALLHPNPLAGASGAVAAVTTAYLALFPRSRVLVLLWLFLFIQFIEVPAMIIIGLKIIVWDNIIAPSFGDAGRVAHHAHLAGYIFGFTGAMLMLLIRALPRDQFDMLALWQRWHRRREFAAANWSAAGAVLAEAATDPREREAQDKAFYAIADLRSRITGEIERRNVPLAAELYLELLTKSPQQCLSEPQQLAVAREFYSTARFPEAAAAFDCFVRCYPSSIECGNVRLLLGIIYARDLRNYEDADRHLTQSWATLRDEARRDQCQRWLRDVRQALGRPAPDAVTG